MDQQENDEQEQKQEFVELGVIGQILECQFCNKKIIVERALSDLDIDNTVAISAHHWECLSDELKQRVIETYGIEDPDGKKKCDGDCECSTKSE